MGSCLSSSDNSKGSPAEKPSVNIISVNGELRQYTVPVTASQVVQLEEMSMSASSSCFLCNSDSLYFDDYIQAMHPEDELLAGQIYFVFPTTKLDYRLSASDMAALAVKASTALQVQNRRKSKNNKARISPLILQKDYYYYYPNQESVHKTSAADRVPDSTSIPLKHKKRPAATASSTSGLGISRSGSSVRKLQRYSSRRAKLAVRSFRIRLSTIYEGSVLLFN